MKTIESMITIKEIITEGRVKYITYDQKDRITSEIIGDKRTSFSYNGNIKIKEEYRNEELQYVSVYENSNILYSHNIKRNIMIHYTYDSEGKLISEEARDILKDASISKIVYKYNKDGKLKGQRVYKEGLTYSDFVYSYLEDEIVIKKYYNGQSYYIVDVIDKITGATINTKIVYYSFVK